MASGNGAPAKPLTGRSVAELLRNADSTGIRVIFTDESVPSALRVVKEPTARDPVERLRQILQPHALVLNEISPSVYAVTRLKEADRSAESVSSSYEISEQVQVTASRYTIKRTVERSLALSRVEMERQPALFNDAARSIRRFPGTAGHDLASDTFVRGGMGDENLIVLDGVPLYNPFHLKGLPIDFSVIDPTVLERVDFYSGVLPVQYSGRMSALIDLQLRDPAATPSSRIALGTLDTSIFSSAPFADANGDSLLFARCSLLGVVTHLTEPAIRPELMDVLGRLSFRVGDHSILTVGGLVARDRMINYAHSDGFLDPDPHHHSSSPDFAIGDSTDRRYAWTVLDRSLERLHSRTTFAFTSLQTSRFGDLYKFKSNLAHSSGLLVDERTFRSMLLKQDWSLSAGDATTLRLGASVRRERADLDYFRRVEYPEPIALFFERSPLNLTDIDAQTSLREHGAYLGLSRQLGSYVMLDAGMHFSKTLYSTHQQSTARDPRIGLLWSLSPATRLRFSHGLMTQTWTAAELPVEQGRTVFDAASRNSMQVFALERDFGSRVSLRLELYNKHIQDPRPRTENLFLPNAFLPELRPDEATIHPRASRMKGLDLYVTTALSERWSGWLSYSRSSTRDLIGEEEFVRPWDQPHSGGLGLAFENRGWLLGASLTVHSSWPQTPMLRSHLDFPTDEPIDSRLGSRLSERGDAFLTLDVKVERRVQFPSGALHIALQFANATDRTNVCCQELTFFPRVEGWSATIGNDPRHYSSRVPYVTLAWEF